MGDHNIRGAVGISSSDYAQRTRHLIKLINELRGVGAHADIDLPRIAVIGNQSAGKSSLVEAISGITVPRASGTCTRCPMECRLQNTAGPWKCQVLLRFEKDEMGQRISDVHEIKFGPLLTDKSKLEEMLRRAQLAILNPGVSHASFVDLDTSTVVPGQPPFGNKQSLQFSSNVVALDLSGPDSADLSFIDLPGIISNVADGEDRNNIKLVQDLVKDHIKGNSIILLTLTMRDDLENQSAAFLAKQADPEGLRTIGVLTKADAIVSGEESTWMDVLLGRRHALKKGYYVTKQPGPEDLKKKLSFEDSRRREQEFFATTEPWKSSAEQVKSRIGIPKLTAELSRLLSNLIMQTLPKLREDARQALKDTSKELGLLPPPLPENPVIELLRLLTGFSTEVKQWIDGSEGHKDLVQIFNGASTDFKEVIFRTAPDFRPFKDADEENTTLPKNTSGAASKGATSDDAEHTPFPPMFLSDVREYVQRSRGRELPYNVPFSAKKGLIEASCATWESHAMSFFEVVCQAATKLLNDTIDDHFGRFALSPLKDNVKSVVERQINHLREDTRNHITRCLELENPPFTMNTHYFSSSRDKFLSKYRAARNVKPAFDTYTASTALSALAALGFQELSVDDLQKLNKADEYEEELSVMAEVSAYCRVAYKRIIDDVPRIVDHGFLQGLAKHIQETLVEEFGIGSERATERAKIYLAEEPSDVARRAELTIKAERLDEVLKKLFNFGL
ncbi:P-loop containing nucleoside triphosphate hydrolase protein [Gautieria morchelliformis]|nr:P-loop containing nucleoside triphosphate hydrolase protein [Gautieria morchelliformis]